MWCGHSPTLESVGSTDSFDLALFRHNLLSSTAADGGTTPPTGARSPLTAVPPITARSDVP
jgi:hypothetical protein